MNRLKKLFKIHMREKITAIVFLGVVFTMLIGMLTTTHDLGESFLTTYRTNVLPGTPYVQRIVGAIDAAEIAVNEGAFQRQDYVELYGLAQRAMNKKVITDYNYGSLYKTAFNQITFAVSEKYVMDSCMATYDLANQLLQSDVDFLYVQLPFKIAPEKYQTTKALPINVTDYANQNADAFVANLKAANIKTYDVRDEFWTSHQTQNQLFFNTDHHWTIEGAFYTTGCIANYLNSNYNFGIDKDLYNLDNFNVKTYEDYYLGSMGRRVGKIYGGLDDFSLITPKFKTDYTLTQIEGKGQQVFKGSFDKAILEMKYIDNPDVTTNRYAVYHGDYQELRFVNNLVENDKKVLIIKDSFGIPVYSFLSLGVKEVRAIDMRLFEKNVAEYAKEYDPDLVILMYNADSFADPMFDFN